MVESNFSIEDHSSWSVAFPNTLTHNMPMYIEFIGNYYTKEDFYTKRNDQLSYMLMYTVTGNAVIEYDENNSLEKHTLKEHSLFIVNCMNYHYFYPTTPNWNYRWIHISGAAMKMFYELLYQRNPFVIYPPENQNVGDMFIELTKKVKTPSIKNDIIINQTLTNFFTDIAITQISEDPIINNKYVETCINYISNHFRENITIDTLSSLVYISKYHLIELFNNTLGISPYRYLTQYRLNQSKHLLLNTEAKISEIAMEIGYNSESHFIKQFKKYNDVTPLEFRRQLDNKVDEI